MRLNGEKLLNYEIRRKTVSDREQGMTALSGSDPKWHACSTGWGWICLSNSTGPK